MEKSNMKSRNFTKPNTAGGNIKIEMSGRMGEEHRLGGWPNLIEVADLAIKHFNEICDPDNSYMSYVGASLGLKTPTFSRSHWDWVEASSYSLPGRVSARRLTGNTEGEEVEIGQRKLTLASFHSLDGFSYRNYAKGWSESTRVIIWEQARVLFTLMSWFLEDEDERLLSYVRGMLQSLRSATRKEGKSRIFNPPFDNENVFGDVAHVVLVEPLMKYYEITGDPDALDFCEGIINWALDPANNLVDENYRLSGWLRGLAAALAAIARFAAYTADDKLLDHTEKIFRSAEALTAGYGAMPDREPCCSNMELTTAALALTKAGRGEWWDMIDRHFRNQVLESQFLDPGAVELGSLEGEPKPWDDTRDILSRSVGGFSWANAREHMYGSSQLMLCCGGNAMWTLGKIVDSTAREDEKGLSIDFHFSVDTPLVSITNHEPFEGRLEVVAHRDGPIRIRKPSYATKIESEVDGVPASPKEEGSYLVFDSVKPDSAIVLVYPLNERTTEETTKLSPYEGGKFPYPEGAFESPKFDPVVHESVRATWRGNTVLAIDYDSDSPQPKHRLYLHRMERYRKGEGRNESARFYLPERKYNW